MCSISLKLPPTPGRASGLPRYCDTALMKDTVSLASLIHFGSRVSCPRCQHAPDLSSTGAPPAAALTQPQPQSPCRRQLRGQSSKSILLDLQRSKVYSESYHPLNIPVVRTTEQAIQRPRHEGVPCSYRTIGARTVSLRSHIEFGHPLCSRTGAETSWGLFILNNVYGLIGRWIQLEELPARERQGGGSTSAPGAQEEGSRGSRNVRMDVTSNSLDSCSLSRPGREIDLRPGCASNLACQTGLRTSIALTLQCGMSSDQPCLCDTFAAAGEAGSTRNRRQVTPTYLSPTPGIEHDVRLSCQLA